MHLCFSNENHSVGRKITQALVTRKYDYNIQNCHLICFSIQSVLLHPEILHPSDEKMRSICIYCSCTWLYNMSTVAPPGLERGHEKPEHEGFNHKHEFKPLTGPTLWPHGEWASLLVPRSLPATCYTNPGNWASVRTRVTKVGSMWCQNHPSNLMRTLNCFFFYKMLNN